MWLLLWTLQGPVQPWAGSSLLPEYGKAAVSPQAGLPHGLQVFTDLICFPAYPESKGRHHLHSPTTFPKQVLSRVVAGETSPVSSLDCHAWQLGGSIRKRPKYIHYKPRTEILSPSPTLGPGSDICLRARRYKQQEHGEAADDRKEPKCPSFHLTL